VFFGIGLFVVLFRTKKRSDGDTKNILAFIRFMSTDFRILYEHIQWARVASGGRSALDLQQI